MLKIGEKVKFKNDNAEDIDFLRDLNSDLQMDLSDRSITSREFDTIDKAIEQQSIFTVTGIEKDGSKAKGRLYVVSIGKTQLPYSFEEKRFEKQ